MNIILCLDDNNGLLFNHRRLSKDRKVLEDIGDYIRCKRSRLFMNEYSGKMFLQDGKDLKLESQMVICDDYLAQAGKEDECFVESPLDENTFANVEKIVVYRWNRKYPSDVKIETFLGKSAYIVIDTCQFPGNSHENITRITYQKVQS